MSRLTLEEVEGSGGTEADLYGWAWSGTFGWICFGKTCPDDIKNPENTAQNYAQWRSSVWDSGGNEHVSQMYGWARVLSMGDRGWISLNCYNTSNPAACSSNHYVVFDIGTGNWNKIYPEPPENPVNDYNHFAWSGNDDGTGIGWIDFSLAHADWAPPFVGVLMRPAGIFEPQTIPTSQVHPAQFTISLPHLTCPVDYMVECVYSKANGEKHSIEKIITSTIVDQPVTLTDYVPTVDNSESAGRIERNRLWYLETCRLLNAPGTTPCTVDAACGSNGACKPDPADPAQNLCRKIADSSTKFPIFTHFNQWTLYGPEDDFYRAIKCYTGFTDQYFENYQSCDLVGDATFSMAMSKGANVERNCVDGLDNDGANGTGPIDCSDPFCRNISTFCGLSFHKPIRCIWSEAGGSLKKCTDQLYERGDICCNDQPVAAGSDKNHIVNAWSASSEIRMTDISTATACRIRFPGCIRAGRTATRQAIRTAGSAAT